MLLLEGAYENDCRRSRRLGLGGDGMKAREKSCAEEGVHGVTMMVGSGDLPATSDRERSAVSGFGEYICLYVGKA